MSQPNQCDSARCAVCTWAPRDRARSNLGSQLMQYWAFAIPREEINDRLSQVTAVLLALLAFVFIMTSFVPKLTFLTKLDHAVTLLLFSIFLNGWSFVLFYRCGELRIGNWDIDTIERNYVIVAAVFNAIAFLYIFVPAALLH
jgi:hypothetical protein